MLHDSFEFSALFFVSSSTHNLRDSSALQTAATPQLYRALLMAIMARFFDSTMTTTTMFHKLFAFIYERLKAQAKASVVFLLLLIFRVIWLLCVVVLPSDYATVWRHIHQ